MTTWVYFPRWADNQTKFKSSKEDFKIYNSADLLREMVHNGDFVSDVVVTKIEHCQRETAPLHEFLVVRFHKRTHPELANYLIIERRSSTQDAMLPETDPPDVVDTDRLVDRIHELEASTDDLDRPSSTSELAPRKLFFFSASGAKPSSKKLTAHNNGAESARLSNRIAFSASEANRGDVGSAMPPNSCNQPHNKMPRSPSRPMFTAGSALYSSASTIKVSVETIAASSGFLPNLRCVAQDQVKIAYGPKVDIGKAEDGELTLIASLTPDCRRTIPLAQLLHVAHFISKNSPVYDLFDKSCYYYSRAIFDLGRRMMRCEGSQIYTTKGFEFFTTDPLRWGYLIFKGVMADRVKQEFAPLTAFNKCNQGWAEFQVEVTNERRAKAEALAIAQEISQVSQAGEQRLAAELAEQVVLRQTAEQIALDATRGLERTKAELAACQRRLISENSHLQQLLPPTHL
ncbi:hypothetical protein R3P38DRAFT_2766953 [Favolaschia claudopus]|uniref:Uncharacterized protein n=1 Tax=Favolaschia claudopus TaxID=2862362 RepID=A0AAW0CU08_9AGAR